MSLSADEIRRLIPELNASLAGQVIRRVYQADADTLLLRTRPAVLCLSVHPRASRIHLLPALPGDRIPVSDFARRLRRRLEGTRLAAIQQPEDDRAVRLTLQGPRVPLSLMAELTGRHGNVFLLEDDQILGSLYPNRSHRRPNVVGAPYVPLIPRAIPEAASGRFRDAGSDLSAAVAAHYGPRLAAWARDQRVARIAQPLKARLKHQRRLARRLSGDLERHQAALGRHRWADLLLAQPHAVPPRASQVALPDLFASVPEEAPRVDIPLDPRRTPAQNAQRYYRQAARARRGVEQAQTRQREVEAEIRRLDQALRRLGDADAATLDALEAAAADTAAPRGHGRRTARRAQRREGSASGGAGRRRPWHEFRSRAGGVIWVGRGAAENDRLTFRHARGRDVWLHARDVPGAHVVLRLDAGGEPDHQSLLDAATLAAHFSDGREEPAVDVSWTFVKHLRRGRAPGQAYVAKERTLRVRPDAERLARLRRSTSSAARALSLLAPDDDEG